MSDALGVYIVSQKSIGPHLPLGRAQEAPRQNFSGELYLHTALLPQYAKEM